MTSRLFIRSGRALLGRRIPILVLLATMLPSLALALGILVPREPRFSRIQLGRTEVQADIRENLARTRVVQEFYNPNPQQLEADFFFPVPKGADVTDFVLYMNGKPVQGEVLEKGKAREIYEGIVRRMEDPGLLEWADHNLFKVRVFPVPARGTQKIELEFAQPLEADQGTFRYTFPLRAPQAQRRSAERAAGDPEIKVSVEIRSDEPVRNVHSPTHPADVDMKDPKAVRVKVAARSLTAGSGDFVLFYEPSRKDVAMSLVATRPVRSADGFFSLMLSPPLKTGDEKVAPQDVTFVVDTSGSMMEGNKIEQARRALAYCVSQLRPEDRFSVIRFSTEVESFRDGLTPATSANMEAARAWIGELKARGGTNISEALKHALALRHFALPNSRDADSSRIFTVVFVTDGLPTVGVTQPDEIIRMARTAMTGEKDRPSKRSANSESRIQNSELENNVRIFTFGVGNDVNTRLLDRLAEETRAAAEYIRPDEDMEVPISRFFDKISQPAMTGLRLEIPGGEVYDTYPKNLPDLFYGTQLTVFGRYKKAGPTAIRLSGTVAGKPAEFVYEKSLPDHERENSFVEKLWGTRKIAYLLESIRASGESAEVKDEVIQLAKKYGVVTPYTSYLVTEDTPMPEPGRRFMETGRGGRHRSAAVPQATPGQRPMATEGKDHFMYSRSEATAGMPAPAAARAPMPASDLKAESGERAVGMSRQLRAMREADTAGTRDDAASDVRSASGRTFQLIDGVWTDTEITDRDRARLKIKYLSQAYFDALQIAPELREAFALGEKVRIKTAQGIVEIGPDGQEVLEEADRVFFEAL